MKRIHANSSVSDAFHKVKRCKSSWCIRLSTHVQTLKFTHVQAMRSSLPILAVNINVNACININASTVIHYTSSLQILNVLWLFMSLILFFRIFWTWQGKHYLLGNPDWTSIVQFTGQHWSSFVSPTVGLQGKLAGHSRVLVIQAEMWSRDWPVGPERG